MSNKATYVIRFLIKLNWIKTLKANFICLKPKDAIHFPILIFGPCDVHHLKRGSISFTPPTIKFGSILIGISDPVRSRFSKSYLCILGKVSIGEHCVLRRGINLFVTGNLSIGDNVLIADNNTIICTDSITFGNSVRVGPNSVFMDTDYHYVVNTNNRNIKQNHGVVVVGDGCWIGGNCHLKKNAQLPKGTIMAGPFSSLSKNLIGIIPENSFIGGSPAKLIASGFRRVNNKQSDAKIHKHFMESNKPYILEDVIDIDEFCTPQTINSISDELL